MATDLTALKAALKLLADASADTADAVAAGGSPLTVLFAYKNLIPDLMALAPQIGDVPTEAKALAPADYATLVAAFAADLSLTEAHAGAVVSAASDLLQELVVVVLPKILALAATIKKP